MKMMERKAYTAFGKMGFGEMGFGETGFGKRGRHLHRRSAIRVPTRPDIEHFQ